MSGALDAVWGIKIFPGLVTSNWFRLLTFIRKNNILTKHKIQFPISQNYTVGLLYLQL
jgi:hypothetical protein